MAEDSLCPGVAEDGADPALPPAMLKHTERFICSLQVLGGHILHGQYSRQSQVIMGTPSNATLPPGYHFCSRGRPQTELEAQTQISRSPPSPVTALTKCYPEQGGFLCPCVRLLLVMSWPALCPQSHPQATLMSSKAHRVQRI